MTNERLPDSVDEFERNTGEITLRFVRQVGTPNENFYNVFVGKKNIGYMCLPPFSKMWASVCSLSGNRGHLKTRKEAEAYFLRQVEAIMS